MSRSPSLKNFHPLVSSKSISSIDVPCGTTRLLASHFDGPRRSLASGSVKVKGVAQTNARISGAINRRLSQIRSRDNARSSPRSTTPDSLDPSAA